MDRRRTEIERLFRRLKGFRRIFSRFDKLDPVFLAFLHFALIVEALRYLLRFAQYWDTRQICHHERSEGSAFLDLAIEKQIPRRPKPGHSE